MDNPAPNPGSPPPAGGVPPKKALRTFAEFLESAPPDAVEEVSEQLILPGDDATREELRQLLEDWLVERNGMLVPPVEAMIGAIITVKK